MGFYCKVDKHFLLVNVVHVCNCEKSTLAFGWDRKDDLSHLHKILLINCPFTLQVRVNRCRVQCFEEKFGQIIPNSTYMCVTVDIFGCQLPIVKR
jgi:hypothetical protein